MLNIIKEKLDILTKQLEKEQELKNRNYGRKSTKSNHIYAIKKEQPY